MNKGDPTKVDPETSFFKAYQTTEITSDVLVKSVEEARQTISHVTNVTTSYVISDLYNPKLITFSIFTHHVFTTTIRDRESQSFYEAILSVAKFLGYLDQMYIKGQEIKPFIDRVQEVLYDKWNDCVRCPILQDVMKAGFALVADDTDMITRSFTSKTIRFISDIILLQSSLTQSIVFQHVLEIFGRIFAIIPVTNHMNIISSFIDEEKVKTQTEAKHNNDGAPLQPFLRLIRNVSGLQNGIDFAVDFFQKGKTLLLNVTNYISPSLYCTFLQTFSCLIKSEELANNVLQLFEESESFSDVVNLKRFISAINGHAKDLSSHRVGQQLLSDEESYGLEAVIQLLMAISYHSKEYRRRLFATEKIVNSFFLLISSPIPASLKAKCFDILSVLSIEPKQCDEIYKIFSSTQILTRDNVESGRGGIISEIEEIESEEHLYPLTRSFIRFLSSLFKYSTEPINCRLYHQFLFEQCFMKIREKIFQHFNEKWSILSEITQCWTNMSNDKHKNNQCLYHSAYCDSKFLQEYINFLLEDENPQECILTIFRLFLIFADKEKQFNEENNDITDQSLYVSIANRISWSSGALVKIIQCIASHDKDLQICSIRLAKYLGVTIPNLSQVVFTKSKARAISTFKKIIQRNEEEVENELNIRNSILDFLISLGSNSYFLQYICDYNLSDVPKSLKTSTLDKGILPIIIEKLIIRETITKFKEFASNSLKLLLMICDNSLTSSALINLLRSSNYKFFEKLLYSFQGINSSKVAIGLLLQLIARETIDGMENSSSGTTIQTFKILFGLNNFEDQQRRVILIYDFLDQINSDIESQFISIGIAQTIIAYCSNNYINKLNIESYELIFSKFIYNILNKIITIYDSKTNLHLTQSISFISTFLLKNKSFDNIESKYLNVIFENTICAIQKMNQLQYHESKLGLYNVILCCCYYNDEHNNCLKDLYINFERSLIDIMINDLNSSILIIRSMIFTVAEALIPISSEELMNNFIVKSLNIFSSSWELFDNDYELGYLLIISQLSFYLRLLTYEEIQYSNVMLENNLFEGLTNQSFWCLIEERFSTSSNSLISNSCLKIASRILKILLVLTMKYSFENEQFNELLYNFFDENHVRFYAVLDYRGTLTIEALKVIRDLWSLIKMAEYIMYNDKFRFSKKEDEMKQAYVEHYDKIITPQIREKYPNNHEPTTPKTMRNAEEVLTQIANLF